jgi:hypothetical protein
MRKFVGLLATLLLVANAALVAVVGWFVWHYEHGSGLRAASIGRKGR